MTLSQLTTMVIHDISSQSRTNTTPHKRSMSVLMSGLHAITTTKALDRRVAVKRQTLDMHLPDQVKDGTKVDSELRKLTNGSTKFNLLLVKKKSSSSPEIGTHQLHNEQETGQ